MGHKSCLGTFSQLPKYDWKTHKKQWVVILTDFTPLSVRVAAAAASSLQYCSVGSLMADVRQCCFPPGGGGEGGVYVLSGCTDLEAVPCFGVTVATERLTWTGCGNTFALRCLPPHDTNVDCSCDHSAGAPLVVAAGIATDCARVDVRGNFPIKTPPSQVSWKSGFRLGARVCFGGTSLCTRGKSEQLEKWVLK